MSAAIKRPRILRLPQVMEMTGLSRESIYRLARKSDFPVHVELTPRASGWLESEVLAWIEKRLAQRQPAVA